MLLFDGDGEQAWAEASAAGVGELWLELARRREDEQPLDSIPIWQAEVGHCFAAKNNHSYAEAVQLIAHVGTLMRSADRNADFGGCPEFRGTSVAARCELQAALTV